MVASCAWEDPRRAGGRILDTAEGVLIALRGYRLNDAFIDIMRTAKRHNVNPVSLADALVAISENQPTRDLDRTAVTTARDAWGSLLGARNRYPANPIPVSGTADCGHDHPPALSV